jgi:arabinofuranosyltransferase
MQMRGKSTFTGTRLSYANIIAISACALFMLFWFANSYIMEDAFITFRSVQQVFEGRGPRWNPHERVQAFTHPLWFALLVLGGLFTSDCFLNAIVLSGLSVLATLVLVIRRFHGPDGTARVLLLFLGLAISKAFMEYTSGGLESPLSFCLIAGLLSYTERVHRQVISREDHGATVATNAQEEERRFVATEPLPLLPASQASRYAFMVSLLAALILLCRHDHVLLVGPLCAYVLWKISQNTESKRAVWLGALTGCIPFIAWTMFSLLYYGFPFPNSYYAKLNSDMTWWSSVSAGAIYFQDSVRRDPVTLAVIAVAVILSSRTRRTNPFAFWCSIGVLAQMLYVFKIGGDWMSGRFFSCAFLVSLWLVCQMVSLQKLQLGAMLAGLLVVVPLLGADLSAPIASWNGVTDTGKVSDYCGVLDIKAHSFYRHGSSTLEYLNSSNKKRFPERGFGEMARQLMVARGRVIPFHSAGIVPYLVGPDTVFIDEFGLVDAFLARIKGRRFDDLLAGHIQRKLPEGYLESVATGNNALRDPSLRALYDKMKVIAQGPIFSWQRFSSILEMNLWPPQVPR